MAIATIRCTIDQIADWHPHLFLEPHVVACAAVLSQYSTSPARFEVECVNLVSTQFGQNTKVQLELSWSEEVARKAERLRFTMQSNSLTELAAVALAFILTHRVVNLGQLDVTSYGERADYRSLDVPCVVEISGTERQSDFERRHREKTAQALSNPFSLDAYVVVCGFFEHGHRIRFSHHEWQSAERRIDEQ